MSAAHSFARLAAGLAFTCVLGASSVPGAEESLQVTDQTGWHVVEEGETLQKITEKYLGAPNLWPENHKLNPQIRDPHLLRPGQRIKVIVERQVPARDALIAEVANEVDKNLQRSGWDDAEQGDKLESEDGVRTQEKSSTTLVFDDGSELTLNEYSQVFLKEMRTTVAGIRRGSIEVRQGQADLRWKAPRPDRSQIEIVIGDTVARPRVGKTGTAETRGRLSDDGASQLMVFGGSSAVEAAGAVVDVPKGMGTSIPKGEPPKPPEKLLPAPLPVEPASGSQHTCSNPIFTWGEIGGAASYTLEVCADRRCERLVDRATALIERRWQPSSLPKGELFWRVLAVSASRLDGFASPPRPLTILAERPDLQPPTVALAVIGVGEATAAGEAVLGAGGALRLAVRDDACGVMEVRFRWGDETWQTFAGNDLTPPTQGANTLQIEARDRLGRARQLTQKVRAQSQSLPVPEVETVPKKP